MKIGFITASEEVLKIYFPTPQEPDLISTEPPFTPDDQILVNHLREKYNIEVSAIIWGTRTETLKDFDAFIIRSPWDYMDSQEQREKFFRWIKELNQLNIKIFNGYEILTWLLDKHYLKDLKEAGISTVPTEFVEQGHQIDLIKVYERKGPFIIKPCISAAGVGLRFISDKDKAEKEQNSINNELKQVGFLLQDFIKEIKTNGEWSLIFFSGEYSHSLLKKPAEDNILVQGEYGGTLEFIDAPSDIIDFGKKVTDKISEAYKLSKGKDLKEKILYLRVDIIKSQNNLYLSELEGVEPELFFRAKKGSEELFSKKLLENLV